MVKKSKLNYQFLAQLSVVVVNAISGVRTVSSCKPCDFEKFTSIFCSKMGIIIVPALWGAKGEI